MTVRLSPRQAAKRAQIAAAARTLFLAKGYAGTSMDAVTTQAGVSKQTLYSYFPTKIDLLGEIVTGELERLQPDEGRPHRLEDLADLRGVLLDFAVSFTRTLLQPDAVSLVRLVLGEAFHLPEFRAKLRVALPGRVLERTEQLVRAADARGIIAAPAPELTARMFIGPLMTFIAIDGFLTAGEV
ncbi:MAG: TetR/AcrR family transcriptional regulator, partial [Propionicimonas sp.]